MITIPAALERATKSGNLTGLKPFALLYRNKWDSVNNVFALESTPIDISEMIVKPNTLSMTLDVNEIAQYNANNVTLTLSDPHNKFIEGVPGSYFPDGYQLYGSKVVLYYGFDTPLNPQKSQVGYTVIGSPTITDGVVSDFTLQNRIITSQNAPTDDITKYSFHIKFKIGTIGTAQSVFTYTGSNKAGITISNTGVLRWQIGRVSGTTGDALINSPVSISQGDEILAEGFYKGNNTFAFRVSKDGGQTWAERTATRDPSTLTPVRTNVPFYIGTWYNNANYGNPFKGSIDLKETYIKVDDEYWFNGAAFFYDPSVTPVFMGVIKDLPTHKPNKYQVDLKLVSPLELLKDIEARDFSNKVTGETLTLDHIGDNNEEYYITANEGVGGITALYANGVKLYEGVDYNVSDLNDLALPAMIEVVNGSVFGQTFTADYYYWKRALAIEDIVGGLVALGGYDAQTEDIQPVVWQNEVRNPPTISPVLAALGYYEDNADEYKFKWDNATDNWRSTSGSADRRNILPDNFDYSCRLHIHTTSNGSGTDAVSFGDEYSNTDIIYQSGSGTFNLRECGVKNGFSIRITKGVFSTLFPYSKNLFIYQISNSTPTLIYTEQISQIGGEFTLDIKIERRGGNNFTIYRNGEAVATITDSTDLTYQRYFYYGGKYGTADNENWNLYNANMYLVGAELTRPCIVTQTLDKTTAGITWGAVQADLGELDGQTYFLTAYFSNDGLAWGAGTNYNLDTDTAHQERYMYYILGISNAPGMSFDITDPRTYFYATNLVLNMVNLGNSTVLEALQDLSLISGYEFGVDRNGIFFFRPRQNSTTPIYDLDHSEIVSVENVKKNLNDFFTKLTLTFAQIPLEFYANDGTRPTAIDKYGVINKDIDKPDIVNYDNPELAQAIGPQLLAIYSHLRDNVQAVGKLNLALELGDIVNLKRNYHLTADPGASERNKFDRQDTYCRACKITGMNYNFDKRQITYTLRDISDENNTPAKDEFWEFVYDFPIELGAK